MARENIPVGLFYASYPSDCTYQLNSRKINSSYYNRFTLAFEGWSKDGKPVIASINLEDAKPALERMIRESTYGQ